MRPTQLCSGLRHNFKTWELIVKLHHTAQVSSVRVSRDYEIEITLAVGFEQFGGLAQLGSVNADGTKMNLKNAS